MKRVASGRWLIAVVLFFGAASPTNARAADPVWAGAGAFRILVVVDNQAGDKQDGDDGNERGRVTRDERPAAVELDLAKALSQLGETRRPDIGSLQVVRHDPRTGEAMAYRGYRFARGPFDRPFRWDDAAIPYAFPEFGNAVSRTKELIVRRPRVRGGYCYNAIGDWRRGQLTWTHTAGPGPATYGVYFDLLKPDSEPAAIPPRSWIGDGDARCDAQGASTMGADHCRLDLDDWNGDGLVDLIVGEHYGHVFVWPNLGSKTRPKYRYCRYVLTEGDEPLDAGIGAAPKVVDWDGDGRKDLLVGAHWNRLLFYRNVGSNDRRRFQYQGPVRIDGQVLEVPIAPLARGSEQVFKRDYYPVPEIVDWDGDGDLDLLLGGYVTGRVFFYETTGRSDRGTPLLRFRGPLQADGAALNVGHWCAAPCVADFDGDGDLDLVSGKMPMHLQPDEREAHRNDFLRWYEGDARAGVPRLRHTPFPGQGTFPASRLATPRAYDWDNDGDLDLAVSSRANIYLFENQGAADAPRFAMHADPIRVPWGLAPLPADHFRDWNRDGKPDLVSGYTVRLNDGVGNPYAWSKKVSVLPPGEMIAHWSGVGDDWFWPFLDDFDQDGRVDVLFGDWSGHVWLHRNQSTATKKQFDLQGVRLRMTNGELIKVGPINKDPKRDFGALQGARTVLTTGDFDRDGRRDLIVGDTYGIVRWFRAKSTPGMDDGEWRFEPPKELGRLGIRGLVDATDWNGDGWLDVIASAANGKVRVFLNQGKGDGPRFGDGFDPKLPPIIQPRVLMVDMNGDGDDDLFLPGTQGSFLVERSFLRRGYARGRMLRIERRPEAQQGPRKK